MTGRACSDCFLNGIWLTATPVTAQWPRGKVFPFPAPLSTRLASSLQIGRHACLSFELGVTACQRGQKTLPDVVLWVVVAVVFLLFLLFVGGIFVVAVALSLLWSIQYSISMVLVVCGGVGCCGCCGCCCRCCCCFYAAAVFTVLLMKVPVSLLLLLLLSVAVVASDFCCYCGCCCCCLLSLSVRWSSSFSFSFTICPSRRRRRSHHSYRAFNRCCYPPPHPSSLP